jgi:hypothetical protein
MNANGLNSSSTRHRMVDWIKKQDLNICCLQVMNPTDKDKHWLRVKEWKKIFQENGPQKKAREFILIYNKAIFKTKLIKRSKEGLSC